MPHIYLVPIALLLFASPFASSQGASHQAMLASVYSDEREIQEYWVSEKLDGVRGHWDGKALWSRGGHRISTPEWFTEGGRTSTFIRRASTQKSLSLSVFPRSNVIDAAMNSTGWLALSQAVW